MDSNTNDLFLKVVDLGLKIDGEPVIGGISFSLKKGESLAIVGASGSGKTLLGKLLSGQIDRHLGELVFDGDPRRMMVDQQDHFIAFSGRRSMHYGQRYESIGMESVPVVRDFLKKFIDKKADVPDSEIEKVSLKVEIGHLLESKILELSNGERKRTQLAMALLQRPDLLVLDQPFIGLDVHSREKLGELLSGLMKSGICVAIICDEQHIPEDISWVLELKNGQINQFEPRASYRSKIDGTDQMNSVVNSDLISVLPGSDWKSDEMVSMKKVDVILGGKQILKAINWQVKRGEQWALLGHNGAGKSTLLSLITADNPQGYNKQLYLFGKKRGSGETVWDIKKRIGFVSSELHLYFLRGAGIFNTIPGLSNKNQQVYSTLTCKEVIISGFRDEVGYSSPATGEQVKMADLWLSILNLDHLKKRLFTHTSLGEQRLLLLARALVKTPELLILDEPCQGLDHRQTLRFTNLLDAICRHLEITLIYVTHYREEIPTCVSHLLQLERGEMKYCGEYGGR